MIRRKPIEDDDDNPERWLISYADFMTLLFAFFVVMYAISSVNESKYQSLTNSMGSAFIGATGGGGQTEESEIDSYVKKSSLIKPLPMSHLHQEKRHKERETMRSMGKNISTQMGDAMNNDKVRVFETDRGIRIDISESLLFKPGSATLKKGGAKVISEIAVELAKSRKYIQVEGHTDINPISTPKFKSNWELSTARATTILHELIKGSVLETRLSAVGYGASQPISVINTDAERAKNRRVSIISLYESNNPDLTATEISQVTKKTP
jgi:chemotaxis protein MotB